MKGAQVHHALGTGPRVRVSRPRSQIIYIHLEHLAWEPNTAHELSHIAMQITQIMISKDSWEKVEFAVALTTEQADHTHFQSLKKEDGVFCASKQTIIKIRRFLYKNHPILEPEASHCEFCSIGGLSFKKSSKQL